MLGDDEPTDPLVDPFASIDNDPLNGFNGNNGNGYNTDTDSDECISEYIKRAPASLTITPSPAPIAGLQVHKIPVFNHSVTITKIEEKKYFGGRGENYAPEYKTNGHGQSVYDLLQPKRRGRKKGSKNKFKRGIPIEMWKQCSNQFGNGSLILTKAESPFLPRLAPLIKPYASPFLVGNGVQNGQDESRPKRKYTKRPKYEEDQVKPTHFEVPVLDYRVLADPGSRLVVEVDPAEYYPDEPFPRDKIYRKRRGGPGEDRALQCDICRKGFKCAKGVQAHKSQKHGIEDLKSCYPCEVCPEVFILKRDLTQHLITHQDANGRLPCPDPTCKSTEPDIHALRKHKAKHHPYLGTLGRDWFHTWGDR